jgi:hypothetical protein
MGKAGLYLRVPLEPCSPPCCPCGGGQCQAALRAACDVIDPIWLNVARMNDGLHTQREWECPRRG